MAGFDSIVAFIALFSTVGIATVDFREGGKALGIEKPFSTSQALIIRRGFHTQFISSTESSIRATTSLAFFYLAYKDYKRATYSNRTTGADLEIGLASWRWKAWALCGAAGLAVGLCSPYRGLLIRPLEQRLQNPAHLSDGEARKIVARWGKLTLGKGVILLASFPIGLRAFWLTKRDP